MQVAVITDIHANLPALEAVLASAEKRKVEQIWCLGDIVGYGADPNACAALARDRCDVCLLGNHDLAVLDRLDISSFSEAAAEAVSWTKEQLGEPAREFLGDLHPTSQQQGIGLFHASPRDPVWEYVLSVEQAHACLEVQPERLALVGHSHVALFFTRFPNRDGAAETRGDQAEDGLRLDLSEGRWLLNPGSVGQPRDGDPRAAWMEIDTRKPAARYHRVEYDIERAAASIVEAGLPKRLADRLQIGQ